MEPTAHDYLKSALDIMEHNALHRAKIDWAMLRRSAEQRAASAQVPADAYPAIAWALAQLGDRHSFFAPPERGDAAIETGAYSDEATTPTGALGPDGVGYLHIPAFRGSPELCARYATELQNQIRQLDGRGVLGWIVDLTENGGGNMGPMLAGLGPLLGEGTIGAFSYPNQPLVPWRYEAGRLLIGDYCLAQTALGGYKPRKADRPIAVLTSEKTASSGEAVVLAFAGHPHARRFGSPTRGLTSANDGFTLADGASIALTVALFVGRDGRTYDGPIEPDQPIDGARDELLAAARAWLRALT